MTNDTKHLPKPPEEIMTYQPECNRDGHSGEFHGDIQIVDGEPQARAATEAAPSSLAERAITWAESAARNAESASIHYAETLPQGYANGIVPHQATTLAQYAADLATMSAATMRRAMAAAVSDNVQDDTPHHP